MSDQNVAVIGAGPAGLTAAYALTKAGVRVDLFEASHEVGGMSKTIELWGQRVDLGPHRFFSSDPRVNRLWLAVAGGDYQMVDRLTRIYYQDTFFSYPLKAGNALRGLGVGEALRCVASYAHARMFPEQDEGGFDAWVTNRFGRRLFEIFFKSYSEKLWGIPCRELDADFAAQRIKKLSLSEAIKAALGLTKRGAHKTLVDQFAYPTQGTGAIYQRMSALFQRQGGHLYLGTPTRAVKPRALAGATQLELASGELRTYSHIISTMPLTGLVRGMNPPAEVQTALGELKFRNTILVFLEIEGASPFPDQWIYVHSPNLQTGRITNFRNWLPSLCGESKNTILCLEFWCYDNDALWSATEEELIRQAGIDLGNTSLTQGRRILNGKVVRVPKSYPVYRRGYREHLEVVMNYLKQFDDLTPIGRYGAFKYNNQDHSILMGLLAAENLSDRRAHDLWSINTDYEYQEAQIITKTGLQPVG